MKNLLAPFTGKYGKTSLILTITVLPITLLPFTGLLTLGIFFTTGKALQEFSKVYFGESTSSARKTFWIGGMILAGGFSLGPTWAQPLVFLSMAGSWFYSILFQKNPQSGERGLTKTLLGLQWIPFCLAHLTYLHALPKTHLWLLGTILISALSDISGMAFGKAFGKRKMIPQISPNKTVAGYAGQILGAFLGAALCTGLLSTAVSVSWKDTLALGILGAVFAPLGDLAGSLLKRAHEIKDWGDFLPGQGGVLDRVNSLLFLAPAVYYWLKFIRPLF